MSTKKVCILAAAAGWLLALLSCRNVTEEQSSSQTTCAYAVEHYEENLEGSFPDKADFSETFEGTAGAEKSYTPKDIEGFTYDESLTKKAILPYSYTTGGMP